MSRLYNLNWSTLKGYGNRAKTDYYQVVSLIKKIWDALNKGTIFSHNGS